MTKSPFLFDSYALLLLLQKEKGFEKVVDLLGKIHQVEHLVKVFWL
jgi:PIN domain nuclease of toxin-antitoxin system